MENVARLTLSQAFRGRRILVTGHTGFKGSWLALWLEELGAQVTGFALAPETEPSAFEALAPSCHHILGDVRNRAALQRAIEACRPEFVFHLAAQPLVLRSYREPLLTFETNVIGTANLLSLLGPDCAIVVVTSDKCYRNPGDGQALAEDAPLGGKDPYSASKAAQELVVESFRHSFGLRVASARAGNVIGGGDYAEHRLLPDAMRALFASTPVRVRNPASTRPWQHVAEPLLGYLLLASRLAQDSSFARAFNFGPDGSAPVEAVVQAAVDAFGRGSWVHTPDERPEREAAALALDNRAAKTLLGWRPHWSVSEAVHCSVLWYRAQAAGAGASELRRLALQQLEEVAG